MHQGPYWARIAEDGRAQRLINHLCGTALLAKQFAAAFGMDELCGLAHDLGKYSDAFQARLLGSSQKADHSTAGSQALFSARQLHGAFCVAGHHGGLPDGGNRKDGDEPTLCGRMKKLLPSGGSVVRGQADPLPHLLALLTAHIEAQGLLTPSGAVNTLRAEVLDACIRSAESKPGLFSLTVPTGGGKTLSSLSFALHHAAEHGMERVIYVIPYCSIIDQTAETFRDIFGAENVLEHHSGADWDGDEDDCLTPHKRRLALAAENWDAPIIVTTSVQLFESLYANRSSKCRKLHNIANSVVIFDEAQMLPAPCLKPCVSAIGLLAERYRVSVLVPTGATGAGGDCGTERKAWPA